MNKPWIKNDRKLQAIKHTADMEKIFSKEINKSVTGSYVYHNENLYMTAIRTIVVEDLTTDAAVQKYNDMKCCVLNFASYKYPGGGFIIGAIAQEEALCHASNLYNVIGHEVFEKYYEDNRTNKVNSLYKNFAIFSPDIVFTDSQYNNVVKADVITCPAPNLSGYKGSDYESYKALDRRIKFILDIAQEHKEENLILGAFGCGVFKNDPTVVAEIFKDYLKDPKYDFKRIIFAVPAGPNLDAFKTVFNK